MRYINLRFTYLLTSTPQNAYSYFQISPQLYECVRVEWHLFLSRLSLVSRNRTLKQNSTYSTRLDFWRMFWAWFDLVVGHLDSAP